MPYLKLDDALVDMIRAAEVDLRRFLLNAHCGVDIWEAEIAWDYPVQKIGDEWDEEDATATHAVGFIAGVAAAFDVTPLELLGVVKSLDTQRKALEQMAGVSDPSLRQHAVAASRMLDASTPRSLQPLVDKARGLTTREIAEAQGFDLAKPRAKRPTAQRRQKIQIPPKKK